MLNSEIIVSWSLFLFWALKWKYIRKTHRLIGFIKCPTRGNGLERYPTKLRMTKKKMTWSVDQSSTSKFKSFGTHTYILNRLDTHKLDCLWKLNFFFFFKQEKFIIFLFYYYISSFVQSKFVSISYSTIKKIFFLLSLKYKEVEFKATNINN